jgi:diaminopimelate decarboxylase
MLTATEAQMSIGGVSSASLASEFGTPLYVYDADEVRRSFRRIVSAVPYAPVTIHYACVTNANLALMRLIHALGGGIHANTWGDAVMALHAGFASKDIVYSGSNISADDFQNIFANRVRVNVNSLSQLRQYAAHLHDFERRHGGNLNVMRGVGMRIHLEDKMLYSRMGVKTSEIAEARDIAAREGLRLTGVHYYRGTGTIHIHHFLEPFPYLMEVGKQLGETLEYVDIGGGFGYPYMPGGPDDFNWEFFGASMNGMLEDLSSTIGRRVSLVLEPGRSVVASSGYVLSRVVAVDRRAAGGQVVGVDTTVSHISSETFRVYGGYRRIALANRDSDEQPVPTDVVGSTTFSDDYIGRAPRYDKTDRGILLPPLHEGDLLAVLDAGGYGFAFASNFLNKPRPAEVLIDGGQARLVRRRETYDDMLRLQQEVELSKSATA